MEELYIPLLRSQHSGLMEYVEIDHPSRTGRKGNFSIWSFVFQRTTFDVE